ncbi:MAG: ABC transporter permease [Bacteroidota bacterium]
MSPIALVARSEFLRRVRSKWFIATTLLAPVLTIAVVVVPVIAITSSGGDEVSREVAVLDETGRLALALAAEAPEGVQFVRADAPADSLRQRLLRDEIDAALILPEGLLTGDGRARYLSASGGGLTLQSEMRGAVRSVVRAERARLAGAGDEVLDVLDAPTSLDFVTVTDDGDAAGGAEIGFLVANVLGLLVYIAVLLYGAMVMRGVIEEKTNRIVEVVVSSVRPFDLLMGKVLGIGAVGLVQLVSWGVLLLGLNVAAAPILAFLLGPEAITPEAVGPPGASMAGGDAAPSDAPIDPSALAAVLTPGLIAAFVLFFLGGYLLFASLFAAVGSMVDTEADAQSLQVPVILPIIVPLLFLPFVVDQPDSALSVALSLFPLSSPVLMVVRMSVAAVPLWQVLAALLLLALAFVGAVWLAARIYRVGILMTGKKATFKDLARWVREAG